MRAYRPAVAVLACVMIVVGLAIVVRTAFAGAGAGFLIGPLFVAAGAGRLTMLVRGRR